jgi:UDP-N-acetyl-D-galactosamine dehydrogenase
MILAGRRINDSMGAYVAGQVLRRMVRKKARVVDARILVLGMTFKENCPDIRNSKVIDIVRELEEVGANVEVYDPWVGAEEIQSAYGVAATAAPEAGVYDAIVLAVGHQQFRDLGAAKIREWGRPTHVLYDVKSLFPASETDGRL